jgi:hypothetical protein
MGATVLGVGLRPGERVVCFARRRLGARNAFALVASALMLTVLVLAIWVLDHILFRIVFGVLLALVSLLALVVCGVVAFGWAQRPLAVAVTTERVLAFTHPRAAVALEWSEIADVEAIRGSDFGPGSDSVALELGAAIVEELTQGVLAAQPKLGPEYWTGAAGVAVTGKNGRRIVIDCDGAALLGRQMAGELAGHGWLGQRASAAFEP